MPHSYRGWKFPQDLLVLLGSKGIDWTWGPPDDDPKNNSAILSLKIPLSMEVLIFGNAFLKVGEYFQGHIDYARSRCLQAPSYLLFSFFMSPDVVQPAEISEMKIDYSGY